MREIFSELYKKVLGFFQTQEKENVKEVACNRLKLVLMQDRTNLTPLLLERMRGEMIDVLSKYVEMDKEALELNFEQEGEQMALMLSIPVLRAKDEEEIQAIIEAEDEAKAKAEAVENDEDIKSEDDESETNEAEEESEETDEDISEEVEEEVCACSLEESEENSDNPDEVEEISMSKSRKKK